jgi:hypothetical protein
MMLDRKEVITVSDHFLAQIKIKQKLITDKSKSINGTDNY